MKKTLRTVTMLVVALLMVTVILPMTSSLADNRSVSIALSYKVRYITKATTTASLQCTIGEKPIVYYWFDWKADLNCWRLGSQMDGGSETQGYYKVPVGYDCYEFNMAGCSGNVGSYTTVSSGTFSFSMTVGMEGESDVNQRNLTIKYATEDGKQAGSYTHTVKQYGIMTFKDTDEVVVNNVPEGYTLRAGQSFEVKSGQSSLAPTQITFVVDPPPPQIFTVNFVDWDDNILKTEQVEEGKSATPPETDPFREGYVFTGWDGDYTRITADTTFKAQYAQGFEVKFLDMDGNVIETQGVTEGEDAVPPEAPAVLGYVFCGWDTDYKAIAADTEIKAVYALDANLDGYVNTGDAVFILRYCVGLDELTDDIQNISCDYNADTLINTGDAVQVLMLVTSDFFDNLF